MESNSDQELFEIFAASLTNSAYPKVVFTLDGYGLPKDPSEVSWECAIAEEQGFSPIIATRNVDNTGWIFFGRATRITGFLRDGVFDT